MCAFFCSNRGDLCGACYCHISICLLQDVEQAMSNVVVATRASRGGHESYMIEPIVSARSKNTKDKKNWNLRLCCHTTTEGRRMRGACVLG